MGCQLLVSVRDAEEAEAALAGGADLIDVKEPNRGSLGRADTATIVTVVKAVGGRAPVSAALGELREYQFGEKTSDLPVRLAYVKWGLSGLVRKDWQAHFLRAAHFVTPRTPVLVAYADWARANSPRPDAVVSCLVESPWNVLLLDTYGKDGSTLCDWLSIDEIGQIIQRCRSAGKRIALAGSLGLLQIERLLQAGPDWIAVRGAACEGGRGGSVSENKVRTLAELVHGDGH